MGWTSSASWPTRTHIIKEILKDEHWAYVDGRHAKVIESCYKGGRYAGRLWMVLERPLENGRSYRFILVNLLQYLPHDHGWAYKDISEHQGPCEVDCPLRFLDLAPIDQIYGDMEKGDGFKWATDWREKVKEFHAKKTAQNSKVKSIKVGEHYHLLNSKVPMVEIVTINPLRGQYQYITYRIPKKMLGDKFTVTPINKP